MKLFVCAVAVCLIAVSYCADKKPGDSCTSSDNCTGDSKCMKEDLYCSPMKCFCEPDKVKNADKCEDKPKPKASKGEACEAVGDCLPSSSLECTDKKCQCPSGKPNFTMDKKCTDKKMFDEECTDDNSCYNTMKCTGTPKKCACKPGKKNKDSNDKECSMENYAMFDEDCSADKPCKDGIGLDVCPTNDPKKCKCKDGLKDMKVYYIGADNKKGNVVKCLNVNATVDAGENQNCTTGYDDTADAAYCKEGFKCHKCGSASQTTCMKYVDSGNPSGVEQMTFSTVVVLGCVALRKFFM